MIISHLEQIQNIRGNSERNPLVSIAVVSTGHLVIIKKRFNVRDPAFGSDINRKAVCCLSESSAARMRRYLRDTMSDYIGMVTLTYPYGHGFDGEKCKRDLSTLCKRMRRYSGIDNPLTSIFWFMEFQERGSIHFHLFTTDYYPKNWLANAWYEICGTEDIRHLRAGTRIESIRSGKRGMSAYASKYAAKQKQKIVPEDFGWTGRFWGVCGRRHTCSADTIIVANDINSRAVMRKIRTLQNLLESSVLAGQISNKSKITGMDDLGITILYVKEDYLIPIIRQMITQIEITRSTSLVSRMRFAPELFFDLSEDKE